MLVNEIVTNAFKHALGPKTKGIFKIDFLGKGDLIKLRISDNGPGMDNANSDDSSLGHLLIHEFVQQLNGNMEIINGPGTTYLITFKK